MLNKNRDWTGKSIGENTSYSRRNLWNIKYYMETRFWDKKTLAHLMSINVHEHSEMCHVIAFADSRGVVVGFQRAALRLPLKIENYDFLAYKSNTLSWLAFQKLHSGLRMWRTSLGLWWKVISTCKRRESIRMNHCENSIILFSVHYVIISSDFIKIVHCHLMTQSLASKSVKVSYRFLQRTAGLSLAVLNDRRPDNSRHEFSLPFANLSRATVILIQLLLFRFHHFTQISEGGEIDLGVV